MSEKSYVSTEQKVCLVTGQPYDSGSILIDKRTKASMEYKTVTGWGISPEVQEKIDEGYIALVGSDPEKSIVKDGKVLPENVYRTGKIAYLRRLVLKDIINVDLPENIPFVYVADEVIDKLEQMTKS